MVTSLAIFSKVIGSGPQVKRHCYHYYCYWLSLFFIVLLFIVILSLLLSLFRALVRSGLWRIGMNE